jgi:competence protein ComEC
MSSKQKRRFISGAAFFLFSLVAVTVIPLTISGQWRGDALTIWVFDVGQGDAIFIDGPDAQVLVDGGPNGIILEKLNTVLPIWDRHIDAVINTHPHADHVAGLVHVLDQYAVEDVYVTGQEYGVEAYQRFDAKSDEQLLLAEDIIDLGNGAYLETLFPAASLDGERLSDPNAGSIVLVLHYGETSMLLTGDIGIEEELQLIPLLTKEGLGEVAVGVDVLKVGHHGSITSSHPDFLELLSPTYSIISLGENSYGHPSDIVLDRLHDIGSITLRTDIDGDIRIWSDGGEPEVSIFSF